MAFSPNEIPLRGCKCSISWGKNFTPFEHPHVPSSGATGQAEGARFNGAGADGHRHYLDRWMFDDDLDLTQLIKLRKPPSTSFSNLDESITLS
ncbi:MAG: hypothetical protein B6D58_06175 [candidate division Zixibacteria bacterium 4484_95]|nr:MAG: hypothetical protein B6D58_06175 [candidate division Zixibacteria bacterium 4484_95]